MSTQNWNGAPSPAENPPPSSKDPFPVGTVILGKYTVERALGEGGMGIVVAARHKDLGCLHAIKFLLPGKVPDRQSFGRFMREARASAKLQGEHLVRVHDVGELDNGDPYMIMEYLNGQDLRSILKVGPLRIDTAVSYLLQVFEAVEEAHTAGIVHRDLKPANLFLTKKKPNGTPCVKVLDFGIARVAGPDETELTNQAACIGSFKYMSPEQLLDSKSVDHRADIWSLGVIAYEFMTGKQPFRGHALGDIIAGIQRDEPEPPSFSRPELPPAMEAVILKCLRKPLGERFQTVEELADALREAAGIVVDSQSVMRLPMPSVSVVSEVVDVVTLDAATNVGTSVTNPKPIEPKDRFRLPVAVASALVTMGVVVGLVLALRHGGNETAAASMGVEPTAVASGLVPPVEATHAAEPEKAPMAASVVSDVPAPIEAPRRSTAAQKPTLAPRVEASAAPLPVQETEDPWVRPVPATTTKATTTATTTKSPTPQPSATTKKIRPPLF